MGFKPLFSLKNDVTDGILQKKMMNLQCLEKLLFDLFEIFQADIKCVQRKLNFNGNSK